MTLADRAVAAGCPRSQICKLPAAKRPKGASFTDDVTQQGDLGVRPVRFPSEGLGPRSTKTITLLPRNRSFVPPRAHGLKAWRLAGRVHHVFQLWAC